MVYDDHAGQEEVLKQSGLDWTVVRPVTLHDGESSQIAIINGPISEIETISRRSVAYFILDCLENNKYIREAPVIAGIKTPFPGN
jgi:uncharacterized protein YbjT (DUF2867 family)